MMPTRSLEFSNASGRTRDGTRRVHWADEGSLRLLEFVARELAGARLLLISGSEFADRSRELLEAVDVGAVGYLPKRQIPDELVGVLERALRLVRV